MICHRDLPANRLAAQGVWQVVVFGPERQTFPLAIYFLVIPVQTGIQVQEVWISDPGLPAGKAGLG